MRDDLTDLTFPAFWPRSAGSSFRHWVAQFPIVLPFLPVIAPEKRLVATLPEIWCKMSTISLAKKAPWNWSLSQSM